MQPGNSEETFESQCTSLQNDLDGLTERIEKVNTLNVLTASSQLKQLEGQLEASDEKTAGLNIQLTKKIASTPIYLQAQIAAATATGVGSSPAQTQQLIGALGSMNQGVLSILRIQQKSQSAGALIERKHAYIFGFFSLYLGVIIGLIGIALGIYPIWHDWKSESAPPPHAHDHASNPPEVPPRLAIFPIMFPANAKGEPDHWTAGIKLGSAEVQSLDFLMRSLRGCSSTGQPAVRLQVAGFASSAEFQLNGEPNPESQRLNLEAANRRANEVASVLEKSRGKYGLTAEVQIDIRDWKTFEEMASHRPFNDRSRRVRANQVAA